MAPTKRDHLWAAVLTVGRQRRLFTAEHIHDAIEADVTPKFVREGLRSMAELGYVVREGGGTGGRYRYHRLADEKD